jgi:aminoglycoside phosphotransferase (APT) family kinase protein
MLREDAAVEYLMELGLIGVREIVGSGVSIFGSSRKNCNYKIVVSDGSSYFLKQNPGSSRGTGTLVREAEAYGYLSRSSLQLIRRALPRAIHSDPEKNILVLELKGGASDLREYHVKRRVLSKTLLRQLGRILSDLHSVDIIQLPSGLTSYFRPLPLDFLQLPASIFYEASAGNLEVVRLVQGHEGIRVGLSRLAADWEPTALIHGDVKWDNCLACATPGASRMSRLFLVDWEFCSVGDPLWEVGSVLAECIVTWLNSIPLSSDMSEDFWVESARFPLERMHPAIAAFWLAYFRQQKPSVDIVQRAVCFCAARILQTAFESSQLATSLDGRAICYLQVAANLFERPLEAGALLLGLPLDG